MNTRYYMVIIKGEIKTSEIMSCGYNRNTQNWDVKFNNGKTYSYAYLNVEKLTDPEVLNPNMYRISRESLKKAKAHYAKLKFEIYDDYTRTNITREQMAKKTAEVKNKIAELDKMIAEKQELFDLQKDLFVDAKQEQLTKLSKLDKFDEDVIRNIIDYVLIYDNEHIEIKWNFDDFHIE